MPIHTSAPIKVFGQEEFHAIDRVVTGTAFKVHNEYGRYFDERLYQAELAQRFSALGLDVLREMRMTLTLDDFRKDYYADFLLNGGVIVETKTADSLTRAHKAQVLNYLYMCGLHHATLLNLRPERVQHQFVSTSYTQDQRRKISVENAHWEPMSTHCELLKATLLRTLEDWGACLDPIAYRDAVTHFLGGESRVAKEVEIRSGREILGRQTMHLLSPDAAFSITAAVHSPATVLEHLRRFLWHTQLRAMQWVNLDGPKATFHTIKRT